MSDQSNARFIQKNTDLSYQQALNEIRRLKSEARELVQNKGWTWRDAYLRLIIDRREIQEVGVYTREEHCIECNAPFWVPLDRKGLALDYDGEYCPECREETNECLRCGQEHMGGPESFCWNCRSWIGAQ